MPLGATSVDAMSGSARQILSVDVGPLRERIEARAAAEGRRAGPWVRQVLEAALGASEEAGDPRHVPGTRPAANRRLQGGWVKLTARLTQDESALLAAAAALAGLSQAEYVGRLVREEGAGTVVPSAELLALLTDSNQQLAALGRQLRQVARSLPAEPGTPGDSDRAQLLAVAQAVQDQVTALAQALGEWHATRRSKAGLPGRCG